MIMQILMRHSTSNIDNLGNYYYPDSQLLTSVISSGIYEFSWNPDYAPEFYARYHDADTPEEQDYVEELYDYYHPHIDDYRYLYVSYANETAWNEWRTIDAPNVNLSSIEVSFEWYDDLSEEYESVVYSSALSELESRQEAVEYLYPFEIESSNGEFSLSQSYANAQDLEIISIKGYYYDETTLNFDPIHCNLINDGSEFEITSPGTTLLSDFKKYRMTSKKLHSLRHVPRKSC